MDDKKLRDKGELSGNLKHVVVVVDDDVTAGERDKPCDGDKFRTGDGEDESL